MPIQHEVEYNAEKDLGTIRMLPGATRDGDESPPGLVKMSPWNIQFQHGTIPENDVNGVTNEAVLDLLAMRLRALQVRFPCRENALAITNIETARMWLQERTRVRVDQGVEGKHENHVTRSEQAGALGDQDVSSHDHAQTPVSKTGVQDV